MTRNIFLGLILSAAVAGFACGTAPNSNVQTNANGPVNVDAANMPPGLSTSPIEPSANTTPGIPAPGMANQVPKGATPTPGIPDPETLKKPMKPGATPTPGIPDPETLKRQMTQPANVNVPPPPANSAVSRKQQLNKPVRKPE